MISQCQKIFGAPPLIIRLELNAVTPAASRSIFPASAKASLTILENYTRYFHHYSSQSKSVF